MKMGKKPHIDEARDPGSGSRHMGRMGRIINPDGSFNVARRRKGQSIRSTYHSLINISWGRFWLFLVAWYLVMNVLFALIYVAIGVEQLANVESVGMMSDFGHAFFFSVQTFTTLGYGNMHPVGIGANLVVTLESLVGMLSIAFFTGILYGRFARPQAKMLFSTQAIIAPYKDGTALQFRVANRRSNVMMDMEATVLLVFSELEGDATRLRYYRLKLETNNILFMPLTWTVVHPIDENSPLYAMTEKDFRDLEAEVLILVKGFDDGFGQHVYERHSYVDEEIVWGAKYVRPFETDDSSGQVVLDVEQIHVFDDVDLSDRIPGDLEQDLQPSAKFTAPDPKS